MNSSLPALSVIMPAYNCERFLEEAIKSILSQSYSNFELLVIDDGSDDNSPKILDTFAASDSRLRVIRQPRLGSCTARNAGCRSARASLIAMMDADDIALPNRFSMQVEYLNSNPHIGLLGGAMICFSAGTTKQHTIRFPCTDHQIRAALRRGNCFAHNTVIFRRELLEKAGYYRPVFEGCEDYDLWLRFAKQTSLANLPIPLVRYRQHDNQISYAHVKRMVFSICALKALNKSENQSALAEIESKPHILEEDLINLGISLNELEDSIQDAYWGKSEFVLRCGMPGLSRKMFADGETIKRRTRASARSLARRYRARFYLDLHHNNLPAVLAAALKYAFYRTKACL